MFKKEFESKFYESVLKDIKVIFRYNTCLTSCYYDAWVYMEDVISSVIDNASKELLDKLYMVSDEYKNLYLQEKGLI